ncbi:DUF6603 domain-containing protein [Halobellus litoreus]|uniref:DUF6603 domain-containing protein n=1 Tax=Halobellus litoreus TaxID=755310 RepID=A0ABD6DYS2_9EURY|nr:DUF6603 domain-containing protein [Halobellus litoreus]
MAPQHTKVGIAAEFRKFVEPLGTAAEDGPDGLVFLATEAGVDLEYVLADKSNLESIANDVSDAYQTLESLLTGDEPPDVEDLSRIVSLSKTLVDAVHRLDDLQFEAYVDDPDVVEPLFDYLLVRYVSEEHPQLFDLIQIVGAVSEDERGYPEALDFGRLVDSLTSPNQYVRRRYRWGSEAFDGLQLLSHLRGILLGLKIPASLEPQPPTERWRSIAPGDGDLVTERLRIPIVYLDTAEGEREAGLFLVTAPSSPLGRPPGIAIAPYGLQSLTGAGSADGRLDETVRLDDDWTFSIDLSAAGATDCALVVRPGGATLLTPGSTSTPTELRGSVELERSTVDGDPTVLLGDESASNLSLTSVSARAAVEYSGDDASFLVELPVGTRLAVIPAEADGFLRSILPASGIETDIDTSVGWSSDSGLFFQGGGSLSVSLPQHRSLGPVTLSEIFLGLSVADRGVVMEGTASIGVTLGPISGVVERIGIEAEIDFPAGRDGTFGPVDADVGFSPPKGFGISIDASAVTGEGYLSFDAENERYEGTLKLAFGDIVVNAVGLLTTRLPGGEDGFSLLIIISGEFPPIQLGMGVTLNALGGLLGVNRTTQFDVLRSGLKKGSMKSVLFPEDPVRNAPQLISDLRSIFPPMNDRHVIGPMARFAWGTPPIVTADVGILLELPAPIRLAILGRISAVLPAEEGALIELNMDALGVVDFGEGTASVDASLSDSRIVTLVITGDMALRSSWGDNPGFGLSVGGFNPRFTPPPEFPDLRRLSLNLCPGNNPRLRLAGYFAVTSNTVQFGARVDLYAAAGKFSISGYLGFDALFQFDPFKFVVDVAAGVALKVGGSTLMSISFEGMFSGPAPWHVKGRAKFKILFFSFSVSVEKKFGERADPSTLPPPDVLGELQAAIERDGNWAAQLPEDNRTVVSLRDVDATDGEVLAHPLGTLSVRQRVVPLDIAIDRYGSAAPLRYDTFGITDVSIEGSSQTQPGTAEQPRPPAGEAIREQFAPAQYFDLTDDEKLSRPGFERLPAGRRIGNDLLAYGGESDPSLITTTTLEYETDVDDASLDVYAKPFDDPLGLPLDVANALANSSAVAQAETRTTGQAKYDGPDQRIDVEETGYVVASSADLSREGVVIDGATRTEAEQALSRHVDEHPEKSGDLQVVAMHEASDGGIS